jgi:myo-inositol-1(or 4)-monophosphatase
MLNKDNLNSFLLEAERACRISGEEILKIRREGFTVNSKTNDSDIVTTADLAADAIVRNYILKAFPEHKFLSEENYQSDKLDLNCATWILDPVDGTTNFAHGLDHFAVSLALVVDKKPVLGVVYAPALKECYTASLGGGAFLNNLPIKCARAAKLSHSVIATGFPFLGELGFPEQMKVLDRVVRSCRDVRRFGACSLDLCMVARGVINGFYEAVYPWDIAAGMLIAKEAGATASNYNLPNNKEEWVKNMPEGLRSDGILVSDPSIHQQLLELIY